MAENIAINRIINEVKYLNLNEQIEILKQLTTIVRSEDKSLNIMALKGLGKEIWNKIDIDEYINKERGEWDFDMYIK